MRVHVNGLGIIAASIIWLLPNAAHAQDPESPAIPVAHPWDPNSPLPQGLRLAATVNQPLTASVWTALGPAPIASGQRPGGGPVSGRLTGIAAHPSDADTLYVSAAGGGVWNTTDAGMTWTPLTDSQSTLSMGAIAIAAGDPQVIYAGTGEANNSGDSNFGRGLLVSTDGGSTWALQDAGGAFNRKAISEIAVDPNDAGTVYIAVSGGGVNGASGNNGIWKSVDGGSSWTNTTASITTSNPWSSVRIDPLDPTTLYAAVGNIFGSPSNGVYKTTDGGSSWRLLTNAPSGNPSGRIVVAVSPSNPQVLYVSASGNGNAASTPFGTLYKIERSDDGGATFSDLTGGTPNYMASQGWYDTTLAVDPGNSAAVYAAGAAGTNSVLRSTDSGVHWTDISVGAGGVGPHVDHHAAAFDATGRFLDGDDGGVYRYDSASNAWTQLNGGAAYLSTIQFQGIGLHPIDLGIALGGSQDNGTSKYGGSLSWTLVEGGDGGLVKFSNTNPSRVYRQSPVESFGSLNFFRRSDNGGTSWAGKVGGITDNTSGVQNFYSPFAVDPGDGDRVLYGARHVWETTNGGDNWTSVGAAFAANIDSIGLAPSDPNTIYVSAGGATFATTDHGTTWIQHNVPVAGPVADLQVDSTNSRIAFAVVRAFTSGGNVFKTTDGGASWANISGDLPGVPMWSVQADPATADLYYVGTDTGVFRTSDGGVHWSSFGSGLPNAQVFQIVLNPTLGVLAAATHGRGAWEILTSVPTTLTYTGQARQEFRDITRLSATVMVQPTSAPIAGSTVQFTLGTQTCEGITDTSGVARCFFRLTQLPGAYTVTASFAGSSSYSPSSDSKAFSITKEETTLSYTGDMVIANGGLAHVSGVLLQDGRHPVSGRLVTFALGTGSTAQTCSGLTDSSGTAACTVGGVDQPLGPDALSGSFAGDSVYRRSSASANAIVFAFPAHGSFVLGDLGAAIGARQEFWGNDWAEDNILSGGTAPASFKGFAGRLSSKPPTCGVTWTARAGNDSEPPAAIPSYMGVLVAPSARKSGRVISGGVTQIVVVQTDPGYRPNARHHGTGTIVAQFCR
ncbi:MAG TPA: Ig-like domain repeat protein [Vicinamibacterales bacterium]|nr:Ig-like domain repeat protein [Vicinamibacterales bacterium]